MKKEELFGRMIALARRAPLMNMTDAEEQAKLLQEFAQYAKQELDADETGQKLPSD